MDCSEASVMSLPLSDSIRCPMNLTGQQPGPKKIYPIMKIRKTRLECGTLSWQIFQLTDSGSGKMSVKSA